MEKKLAIWLHGGVGTGHFAQGMPILEKVIQRLSGHYRIVLYSQHAPNVGFVAQGFTIKSAPPTITRGWRRWWWLASTFLKDHGNERFNLLFAFWGYPAGLIATVLAKKMKIPSIVYLRGSDAAGVSSSSFGIFNSSVKARIALWTYKSCSVLIVLTAYQKQQLLKFGLSRTISVVPSGADATEFFPKKKQRSSKLRILQIAHLNEVKNQTMLLRTFAEILKHRDAELRIIGFDTLHGQVQQLAADMNLTPYVTFSDVIPHSELSAQYEWADIFVQTSLSEGQGMAVTEAAACGVLITGTNVGIIYDLGPDATISVDVDDDATLARRILEIADNPSDWEEKIRKSIAWSQSHSLQDTDAELVSLINSVG